MTQSPQVRTISDATHRAFRAQVAREDLFQRIASRTSPKLSEPLADAVRRMRDESA